MSLVLVVENDLHTRSLITSAFKSAGFMVNTRDDHEQAQTYFRDILPDLIVVKADDDPGRDLIQWLRQCPPTEHIPLIAILPTEHTTTESQLGYLCLSEPVNPRHLVALAQQLAAGT